MNNKAQVTMETMAGFGIFLILMVGVSAVIFSENNFLNSQSQDMTKKGSCLRFSQAFFETKNTGLKWVGSADWNFFVSGTEIYVDYKQGAPFDGVYCSTLDTNLLTTIVRGDVNISYTLGSGFTVAQ